MLSADVVILPGPTKVDLPSERVIKAASIAGLKEVVVLGITEEGDEYFATSSSDAARILWRLKRAERHLLALAEISK